MKTKEKSVSQEKVAVKDDKDHLIHQLQYQVRHLTMLLEVWRRLGKLVGPVSSVNNINTVLIELKGLGELGD